MSKNKNTNHGKNNAKLGQSETKKQTKKTAPSSKSSKQSNSTSLAAYVVPILLAFAASSVLLKDTKRTMLSFLGLDDSAFETTDPELEQQLKTLQGDPNVTVVDNTVDGLPKVRLGHRVVDLFNGWHFDDILMDAPEPIRPAAVVAFYDSSNEQCVSDYAKLDYDWIAENKLPGRSQLFIARYDMFSAPKRAWYEFTPEMNLKDRFGVTECPQVVFASRKCDGFTEWCSRGADEENPNLEVFGCKNFVESCPKEYRNNWDGNGDLYTWIMENIERDGRPKITKFLGSLKEQGSWLQKREYTTSGTHLRNSYLAQAFPAFTHRGFKVLETPKVVQDWLLSFHKNYEKYRITERWNAESTQLSFHEKPTTFIDMDKIRAKKNEMANKYLKPIVEEWSGMKPLELTSFYGMREYHEGAWLRQHVDRIDTHVLSITISVGKLNETSDSKPWPLRVTDWTGKQVAYDHPPGTMILYESSKLPHGRPTRNEGGIHLGAFVHFKPQNMHGTAAKHWEDVASRARQNQNIHTQFARFRATPEIEPTNPVYAEENIGEGSVWKEKGRSKGNTDQFSVEFRNRADRPMQVFWYHKTQPEPILQGRIFAGTSMSINTYHGHTFYWAEIESEQPATGGKFTIDKGKKEYTYNFGKDGSTVKASHWYGRVKTKINEERELLHNL
eukprot:maker-scaffold_3-snap-gene-11.3-mRNA-1 protein AED:0.20 eAED:0.20 QI:37/1/1/1/1/1/2/243/670